MKKFIHILKLMMTIAIIIWGFYTPTRVYAHGSMLVPESRIYNCRFNNNPENPTDPACRAAVQTSGAQMLYDWNGVNQAAAAGNSRTLIPDGKLCSGGKPGFQGMDLPRSDWKATPMRSGPFQFQYYPTAPHATKDTIFYITRNGWNPSTPLRWGDLAEFCRQGSVPLTPRAQGKTVYKMICTVPARTGRHVIYTVWQRSDSTEAFYSCNDVQFTGVTPPPGPTPSFKPIGVISNTQDLPVGTKLTFRLFDQSGADVEMVSLTLGAGQGGKATWPFVLGQVVNSQSVNAGIGVLSANGSIVPTQQLNGNSVFIKSDSTFNFAIDKNVPNVPPTGTINYPNGIGTYKAVTIVQGIDGNRYQCRPFPNSGWCNTNPNIYSY